MLAASDVAKWNPSLTSSLDVATLQRYGTCVHGLLMSQITRTLTSGQGCRILSDD